MMMMTVMMMKVTYCTSHVASSHTFADFIVTAPAVSAGAAVQRPLMKFVIKQGQREDRTRDRRKLR